MTTWATRRMRFNHDHLKNGFLQSLSRLIRALEGHTDDSEFVQSFLGRLADIWSAIQREASDLLVGAETHSGPRDWLQLYPLSLLSSEDRTWMQQLLLREWTVRSNIRERVQHARQMLTEASEQCQRLEAAHDALRKTENQCASEDGQSWNGCRELLRCAIKLHAACQQLSLAFQELAPEDPITALGRLDEAQCI